MNKRLNNDRLKEKDIQIDRLHHNAVVCDLDGTILHAGKEAVAVPGRTRASFLSADAAELIRKISQIFPLIIATGRNAKSVSKLVNQLPDVKFSGFVLENGFVVRNHLNDRVNDKDPNYSINEEWDKIAALFPDWERLPFYENCAGFVFNFTQKDIDAIAIDTKVKHAQQVLTQNGYTYPVYKEKRKVFIYPDHVDKMRGVKLLGFYPYIAIGDGSNDLQLMQQSTIPVMPNSGAPELKEIVVQKNGFCSMKMEHAASFEMLDFAYNLLINKYTLP